MTTDVTSPSVLQVTSVVQKANNYQQHTLTTLKIKKQQQPVLCNKPPITAIIILLEETGLSARS